ncbi:MAG TPA: aspartate 1-decarboxylase [Candidatus Hydrogenedentes bacterium]|nr:aspartate 1-decarboxylase [Candidatus Hydrogenedentota bacterium]HOL76757.1 aspartate 1-decarboxylase [Candidatus Hydrogenedentota bacterium]HPO85282.1 aspartate 1-decarboxylase [Candidatus Hydrogenedentota bacterium]
MLLHILKSKIHRAVVTEANLEYEGSLTLDPILMEAAGMLPFERIQVLNLNNGTRIETYLIEGKRGSGVVCLNGPAARCGMKGDLVIVLTYALMTPEEAQRHVPKVVYVDANNRIVRVAP